MNKKTKMETSTREKKTKRLKTVHAKPNILSIVSVNVDCFRLEEKENVEGCYEKFIAASDKIRTHLLAMLHAKRGKEKENKLVCLQHRTHICMLFVALKKLNRLDKHQWKKSRDAVNEIKQKVDALHLHYQNLLYEATHLQKEVTKCLEFRSKDEEIELVTIEEFYRDAPESISKPEITKVDKHEQTLARLFWESEQRKRFAKLLKEQGVTKEEYILKCKKLKESMAGILPIIKNIYEATRPFQKLMGLPFQARQSKHKLAKHLPRPLYIFYVQACAFQEHCDENSMLITIEGNVDETKTLLSESSEMSTDSGESDQEESAEVNSHRHSGSVKKEETSKDVLMKHPMSIFVTLEKETKIVLEFRYLVFLHVVTVSVKSLTPEPMSTELVGDLLRHDTFLNCLFPGDTGRDSPNLSSVHLLKGKFGYDGSPFSNDTTGLPFVWAQKLAGLQFMSPYPKESDIVYRIIPPFMEKSINAIWTRLQSRHQLHNQITSLESRISVPPQFASLYPLNIQSQLKNWSPAHWKDALNYANIEELQAVNLVSQDSLVYKAEIQRGSANLSVLVVIPPEYPNKTPVFLLHLYWNGSHSTVSNFALKELEEEVNVHFIENLPSEFKNNLLVCQMYHLVVCFDVFLETEYSGDSFEGPHEFVREKVVVRYSRGCSRSRPYKCVSSQGIFTYR
ncbi:hypothetical protein JTE90_015368 [Oedothorax gibbosus]|uniref:THO complex subunit 5 n=1 Tax=Oedothorax gibbosus TaxID=931172 RepID=A0AAV6U3K7_9ARAC|nr:hypothetical protein JTE90_015368 [Oedothorax gibbosus]